MNTATIPSLSEAQKALLFYIMYEYPEQPDTFKTSMSLGSMTETREEEILSQCMEPDDDWLYSLNDLCFVLATHVVHDSPAFEAIKKFLGDATMQMWDDHVLANE